MGSFLGVVWVKNQLNKSIQQQFIRTSNKGENKNDTNNSAILLNLHDVLSSTFLYDRMCDICLFGDNHAVSAKKKRWRVDLGYRVRCPRWTSSYHEYDSIVAHYLSYIIMNQVVSPFSNELNNIPNVGTSLRNSRIMIQGSQFFHEKVTQGLGWNFQKYFEDTLSDNLITLEVFELALEGINLPWTAHLHEKWKKEYPPVMMRLGVSSSDRWGEVGVLGDSSHNIFNTLMYHAMSFSHSPSMSQSIGHEWEKASGMYRQISGWPSWNIDARFMRVINKTRGAITLRGSLYSISHVERDQGCHRRHGSCLKSIH